MPIDDSATRTLRAAGLGYAPRNERLAELAGLRRPTETGSYRYGFHPASRPGSTVGSGVSMLRTVAPDQPPKGDHDDAAVLSGRPHRYCARPTCSRHAVATMSYDQSSRTVYLGGLSPERDPAFYDLCRFHVDRLTTPTGWSLRRVRPTAVDGDGTDATAATLDGWALPIDSDRVELNSVLG